MSANPDKFPQEVIDNVRNYHMREGNLKDELEVNYNGFILRTATTNVGIRFLQIWKFKVSVVNVYS